MTKKLLALLSRKEKTVIFFLTVLMVVGALLEAAGIGLIVPFIAMVANPHIVEQNKFAVWVRSLSPNTPYETFVIYCGLALVLFYILKNIYLAWLLSLQNSFTYKKCSDCSLELFRHYLKQPYFFHLEHSSTKLLHHVHQVAVVFGNGVLTPAMTVLSESMFLIFITAVLVIKEPLIALATVLSLGGVTGFFMLVVKNRLRTLGKKQNEFIFKSEKWLHQSFGGIKEIFIFNKAQYFSQKYEEAFSQQTNATSSVQFMSNCPKLFIETVAFSGIILIVCVQLWLGKNLDTVLPVLALFSLAALRSIPSLTRIVSSLTCAKSYMPALDDIYSEFRVAPSEKMGLAEKELSAFEFKRQIDLRHLSFRYPRTEKDVLSDTNIIIKKGTSVAFVGPSGVGKTTLIDLLMGLLEPTEGEILVDGLSLRGRGAHWRRNIGYVPQSTFLIDDTIRRNIAFGLDDEKIDDTNLENTLKAAQLSDFVKSLPQKLVTTVGERGVRLSGGQKQRIAIARALYHNPEVLVFDEATSALDTETEQEISQAINRLSGHKTIILITHRHQLAATCNQVYNLTGGKVASPQEAEVDLGQSFQ